MPARGGADADVAVDEAMALTAVGRTGCGLGSDAFALIWERGKVAGSIAPDLFEAFGLEDRQVDFVETLHLMFKVTKTALAAPAGVVRQLHCEGI